MADGQAVSEALVDRGDDWFLEAKLRCRKHTGFRLYKPLEYDIVDISGDVFCSHGA